MCLSGRYNSEHGVPSRDNSDWCPVSFVSAGSDEKDMDAGEMVRYEW